jgi:hypothetical protein
VRFESSEFIATKRHKKLKKKETPVYILSQSIEASILNELFFAPFVPFCGPYSAF